jgi:hypothetical protein
VLNRKTALSTPAAGELATATPVFAKASAQAWPASRWLCSNRDSSAAATPASRCIDGRFGGQDHAPPVRKFQITGMDVEASFASTALDDVARPDRKAVGKTICEWGHYTLLGNIPCSADQSLRRATVPTAAAKIGGLLWITVDRLRRGCPSRQDRGGGQGGVVR